MNCITPVCIPGGPAVLSEHSPLRTSTVIKDLPIDWGAVALSKTLLGFQIKGAGIIKSTGHYPCAACRAHSLSPETMAELFVTGTDVLLAQLPKHLPQGAPSPKIVTCVHIDYFSHRKSGGRKLMATYKLLRQPLADVLGRRDQAA